jgi:hypothetical protein
MTRCVFMGLIARAAFNECIGLKFSSVENACGLLPTSRLMRINP